MPWFEIFWEFKFWTIDSKNQNQIQVQLDKKMEFQKHLPFKDPRKMGPCLSDSI